MPHQILCLCRLRRSNTTAYKARGKLAQALSDDAVNLNEASTLLSARCSEHQRIRWGALG